MTRRGRPEQRLRRAAGALKNSVTFLETIAAEEGIQVPAEVVRAAATIRTWCRGLGATDPAPPDRTQAEQALLPPRPRLRQPWRHTRQ